MLRSPATAVIVAVNCGRQTLQKPTAAFDKQPPVCRPSKDQSENNPRQEKVGEKKRVRAGGADWPSLDRSSLAEHKLAFS